MPGCDTGALPRSVIDDTHRCRSRFFDDFACILQRNWSSVALGIGFSVSLLHVCWLNYLCADRTNPECWPWYIAPNVLWAYADWWVSIVHEDSYVFRLLLPRNHVRVDKHQLIRLMARIWCKFPKFPSPPRLWICGYAAFQRTSSHEKGFLVGTMIEK